MKRHITAMLSGLSAVPLQAADNLVIAPAPIFTPARYDGTPAEMTAVVEIENGRYATMQRPMKWSARRIGTY